MHTINGSGGIFTEGSYNNIQELDRILVSGNVFYFF